MVERRVDPDCDHSGPMCWCDGVVEIIDGCGRCNGKVDDLGLTKCFPPLCHDCIERDEILTDNQGY